MSIRDMVLTNNDRLDALEKWQNELRGAWMLMKFALGTSIVSAAVSVVALIQMLTGHR